MSNQGGTRSETTKAARLPSTALLAIVLGCCLSAALGACGGAGVKQERPPTSRTPARHATLPAIETSEDPDNDSDNYAHEPDNERQLFGRPAGKADTRAVTALVRRYFAAAARDQGAVACGLLYSQLAEAIPATYGGVGGSPSLRGKSCATVLSKLFAQEHGRLSHGAAVRVGAVRVSFSRGSARFGFGRDRPTLSTLVHRERGAWKMYYLLYVEHPVYVE